MAAGVGALMGSDLFSHTAWAAEPSVMQRPTAPKRVIFFLQNHGFDPLTCIPKGLTESGSLNGVALEKPMQALEPYKHRMHVITGLHGRHTSPGHSAYFGALGAFRGGTGVPPSAATGKRSSATSREEWVRISSAGEPSAATRPLSMTTRRSQSCSASSM